jgi:hypothetical protein
LRKITKLNVARLIEGIRENIADASTDCKSASRTHMLSSKTKGDYMAFLSFILNGCEKTLGRLLGGFINIEGNIQGLASHGWVFPNVGSVQQEKVIRRRHDKRTVLSGLKGSGLRPGHNRTVQIEFKDSPLLAI